MKSLKFLWKVECYKLWLHEGDPIEHLVDFVVGVQGEEAVAKHMVAVSTNVDLVEKFGIDPKNTFGFWDWVGGRYSVCSAVGILPLSLQYGFDIMEQFLKGANDMDDHFASAPFEENLPVLLGLLSVWNVSFLGHSTRAILPYCQVCKNTIYQPEHSI